RGGGRGRPHRRAGCAHPHELPDPGLRVRRGLRVDHGHRLGAGRGPFRTHRRDGVGAAGLHPVRRGRRRRAPGRDPRDPDGHARGDHDARLRRPRPDQRAAGGRDAGADPAYDRAMSAATPDPVFTPDPDWVPQHPNPSKPAFTPPPGAVDSNVHVFGPGDRFPYAPERRYTPVDASADDLFALHRLLGIERTVIVQGTAHGTDPRALVDALRRAEGRARGVAAVRPDV